MNSDRLLLSATDYTLIIITLIISAGIGLYFQFANKNTAMEYLLAGKNMPLLPVACSLMATFMSATTFLGIPAEIYLYGTNMVFMNLGFILGPIISIYVFLPVYVCNNVATPYEYLEKRFGQTTRRIISAASAFSMILFTSATLYAPALALSAVTNLSVLMSMLALGSVCTFYSTLGGMKAVLWTDLFQSLLMYISLFAIIIVGFERVGGIVEVFKTAYIGGRLIIPRFTLDISAQYSFISVFVQGLIITTGAFGTHQIQVQRMLTLKNVQRSRTAALLSIPMLVAFHLLCCLCGLIAFAYFKSCDPLTMPQKQIESPDQLLPYLVTSMMAHTSGLPGLCIVGIFSASLSSVSSAINSLAAITAEDIFPWLRRSLLGTKVVSLFYGVLSISLAFVIASLGTLVKLTILITGLTYGPILGVFLLGTCSTVANEGGVLIGVVTSVTVAASLSFIPKPSIAPFLPLSKECPQMHWNETHTTHELSTSNLESTLLNNSTTFTASTNEKTFQLTYMWISSIALITSLIVGYLSSLVILLFQGKDKQDRVPDNYLSPIRRWFSKMCSPGSEKLNGRSISIVSKEKEELITKPLFFTETNL